VPRLDESGEPSGRCCLGAVGEAGRATAEQARLWHCEARSSGEEERGPIGQKPRARCTYMCVVKRRSGS
jgi:hypothetical protein